MGYESRETSTSGYDLEPLWVALDTVGFRDIGRQALRATETIAQSVRSRNRQYRAVAMREDDLASFHRRTATDRARVGMWQFGEVQKLVDEIRNDPEWRSEVLPRLDAALGDDGRGWESVSQLETEAGRALLDLDDLSGKTTQQFLAAMRPYDPGGGAPPEGSFDDLFLGRFQRSTGRGGGICGTLSLEEVEGHAMEGREPFELARAVCVETGFGLLAIATVASTTVPNSRGYHSAALTRLLPTVLSACSTIAAEAPLPDLVPIVDPQSFCVENRIEFAVKNIGPTTAGRFHTTVDFGQHLTVPLLTRELPPGHDVSLQVTSPPGASIPTARSPSPWTPTTPSPRPTRATTSSR